MLDRQLKEKKHTKSIAKKTKCNKILKYLTHPKAGTKVAKKLKVKLNMKKKKTNWLEIKKGVHKEKYMRQIQNKSPRW